MQQGWHVFGVYPVGVNLGVTVGLENFGVFQARALHSRYKPSGCRLHIFPMLRKSRDAWDAQEVDKALS